MYRAFAFSTSLGLMSLGLLSGVAVAELPKPLGDELAINQWTTDSQRNPDVAMAANGDFLVVWTGPPPDGSAGSNGEIVARRFSSAGIPLGDDFQVNTYTTDRQQAPRVAMQSSGASVMVWTTPDGGATGGFDFDLGVAAQRYAADGSPVGGEFQVNTLVDLYQTDQDVDVRDNGEFVVVWSSSVSSGSDNTQYSFSIQGRLYSSDGMPLGSEFQINSYTTGGQLQPDVSYQSNGDFVVVWTSQTTSEDPDSPVRGQRFTSDGTPLGPEFQVNSYTTGSQAFPRIAVAPNDDFVVAWQSNFGSPGDDDDGQPAIIARRFASDGSPLADDFQVNVYTDGAQEFPAVSYDSQGRFVVSWSGASPFAGNYSLDEVSARWFASDSSPVSTEFQVNTYTEGHQAAPSAAMSPSGQLIIVWSGDTTTGETDDGIAAQRFDVPLFCDGFESGSVVAWSSSTP